MLKSCFQFFRPLFLALILMNCACMHEKNDVSFARDLSFVERMTWSQRDQTCFRDSVGMFRLGLLISDAGASFHWRIPSLDVVNVLTRIGTQNTVYLILEIEGGSQTVLTNEVIRISTSILIDNTPLITLSSYNQAAVRNWENYSGFRFNAPFMQSSQASRTNFSQQRGYVLAHCTWLGADSRRPSNVFVWHGIGGQPDVGSIFDIRSYNVDINNRGWLKELSIALNSRGIR